MIRYCKKYYFIKVHESWFDYKFNLADLFYINAYLHIKDITKKPLAIRNTTYTLENDLEQDINKIFSGFTRNIKTGICRAERAGITVCFNKNISGFVEFYNAFAAKKKIPLISEKRLEEIGGQLLLGFALYEGRILAAHSYVIDEDVSIMRIFWGCSARLENNEDKDKASLGNKLLYFKSMIYFKEMGIKTYDWGGYAYNTKDKQLLGINNFKKQYGGRIVACRNYLSVGYFVLHMIAGILGLLGKIY